MTPPGFRLRHLVFLGPRREPATARFGPGLNIVYGASDTGKSFMVEAIDFMLGGKPPLRDIPERLGYDRILLGIEQISGETHTIYRSADGGRFRLYEGLHTEMPADDTPSRDLAEQHTDRNAENLSSYLLSLSALDGKRIRKNKRGDTNSLSFRNVARLLIVTETEITDQRSPLSDGNPTADTANFATFKLLLTGVDDRSMVPNPAEEPEDQTREAQIEILDQLSTDYRERLKRQTKSARDLDDQLDKLDEAMQERETQLGASEAAFRELASRRRDLRERVETGKDRRAEITSLLERFRLLDDHYLSDAARLQGIAESGTLMTTLSTGNCPLCGAEPEHHKRDLQCDGNIESVVAAAHNEIGKIDVLRAELRDTIEGLEREAAGFDRSLPRAEEQLKKVVGEIETLVAPQLKIMRSSYSDLAVKRGNVLKAIATRGALQDIERRRAALEREPDTERLGNAVSDGDLPTTTSEKFAKHVEAIFKEWHLPESDRVFFDPKTRDLTIGGKPRIARGKGLRAITHAAFTIGLLDYCRVHETPHPGFVVLDSPLLAYRAPDGGDDDLRGTDLDIQFYHYLARQPEDRQIIVVENDDPPNAFIGLPQVLKFTGNPASGRAGYFPDRRSGEQSGLEVSPLCR